MRSIKRIIVDTGATVSDFFAYSLQDRYYKHLFNSYMAKGFEGIHTPLSDAYKKSIDDLWKKRYHIKVDKRWFAHYTHCYGEECIFGNGIRSR